MNIGRQWRNIKRFSRNPKKLFWKLKNYGKKHAQYSYNRPDGTFDYERYKTIQTKGNHGKINLVNVEREDVQFLSSYIAKYINQPSFGICHGTRRGDEQAWFSEELKCEVIGTEISDTASDFPNTVQWDFHEEKSDWIGKADFVYSNSFDHSYDPKKALSNWMRTLKPGGICVLEHSLQHTPASTGELDPFGAELDIMPYLILDWSEGNFSVREIITSNHMNSSGTPRTYLVIKNN